MYIRIISRQPLKYQNHFDQLLLIEDFDLDANLFHVDDTLVINLSTQNVEERKLLEVKKTTGIRMYDAGAFHPGSMFANSMGFELRVVERLHTLNRQGSVNEPAQFRHSVTIVATAISEEVEQVLGQFLEILAVEERWVEMETSMSEGISLLDAIEDEHKNEVRLKNRSGKV